MDRRATWTSGYTGTAIRPFAISPRKNRMAFRGGARRVRLMIALN
jgi:hypothetical protein